MKNNDRFFILAVALLFVFSGCSPIPRAFKADYATDYGFRNQTTRRPFFFAQKTDSGRVALSVCVFTSAMKPDSNVLGGPAWQFKLVFDNWQTDLNSYEEPIAFHITKPIQTLQIPDTVWLHFTTQCNVIENRLLVLTFHDLVSGLTLNSWNSVVSADYPLPTNFENNFLIEPWVKPAQKVRFSAPALVEYCERCLPTLPLPPFDISTDERNDQKQTWSLPDSVDEVRLLSVSLAQQGVIRVSDCQRRLRHSMLKVSNTFPDPSVEADGLLAIRYITSRDEFWDIVSSGRIQRQFSQFWASRVSDSDRGEERAGNFISKIREANTYFTDKQAGSLTDRGMIWIVFGKPDRVWKSHVQETWFFDHSDDGLSVRFDFDCRVDDDGGVSWVLRRMAGYKAMWDRAVDRWRR